jgi:hypothetical protein
MAATARVVQAQDDPPQGWASPAFYLRTGAPVLVLEGELAPRARVRTTMRVARLPEAAPGPRP